MRILGGKWTGSILWHLKDGPVRFNGLTRQLDGASKRMVNERLKELEQEKLVRRKVVSTKPIAVTYEITDDARRSASSRSSRTGTSRKACPFPRASGADAR